MGSQVPGVDRVSTADFLLELRCEEIPARMQAGARADLEKLFRRELDGAGLKPGAITVWSTPRRLALIAKDLPLATEAVSEEVKGPRTSAPDQALEGFLRKTGLTKDQLTERDGVWFAITEKPGRQTATVLAEAIPAIIRAFRQLAASFRGETSAEVISAHALSDDQVAALKQSLRQRIGREVSVDLSVDPSLLGGLVVRIGSQMIDSSIKTRLNTLAHAMKG
jgi:hypothetical protein